MDKGQVPGPPPMKVSEVYSRLPAGQAMPARPDLSDHGSSDESSSDGGMLREIRKLESPTT